MSSPSRKQREFPVDECIEWQGKRVKNRSRNGNTGKTHCLRGHEFTTENTYWRSDGGRRCRECDRAKWRSRNAVA